MRHYIQPKIPILYRKEVSLMPDCRFLFLFLFSFSFLIYLVHSILEAVFCYLYLMKVNVVYQQNWLDKSHIDNRQTLAILSA